MSYINAPHDPSIDYLNISNPSEFNMTNFTYAFNCSIPQYMSMDEFFSCYSKFFQERSAQAMTEISVAVLAFLFNLFVMVSILSQKGKTNKFDTILLGHSIVDGLTGLIDIPLFHIHNFFGYWPLPVWLSTCWSCYDNNINFTTNMHMLYMSYVRLRSIQAPKTYDLEILIKHPWRVMIGFWAFGLGVWVSFLLIKI